MPSTYILAHVDVTNPTQYEDYKRLSGLAMQAHGAEVCVRGGRVEIADHGGGRSLRRGITAMHGQVRRQPHQGGALPRDAAMAGRQQRQRIIRTRRWRRTSRKAHRHHTSPCRNPRRMPEGMSRST